MEPLRRLHGLNTTQVECCEAGQNKCAVAVYLYVRGYTTP